MTLSLSVIVPYRPDGNWRDQAWQRIVSPFLSRLIEEWPADAELLVETPPPEGPGHPGDFNHPLAINRAADRSSGELLMICDADCVPDAAYPRLAERALRDGLAQWALPKLYRKLSRPATQAAFGVSGPIVYDGPADFDWIGDSCSWAGCPAYPRAAFYDIGGYDERIAWWGGDDICMGLSMQTLYGEPARLEGVTHMWHPDPPEHNYGHERHPQQWSVVQRYIAAAGDPLAIREARHA